MVRNTLLQTDVIFIASRKRSILRKIKDKFRLSTVCLPQYIDIVHAVGQELFLIAKNFLFASRTTPKIGLAHHLTYSLPHSTWVRNKGPLSPNSWPC